MLKHIVVAGAGTDVGKTLVSAILVEALDADYWKPVQSGEPNDRLSLCSLVSRPTATHHEESYLFSHCLSPHHAARLDGVLPEPQEVTLPTTTRPLVIEMTGGVLVPFSSQFLMIDLFARWPCHYIVVSRHYLGSINHTLLTVEALRQRSLPILGIIFNGPRNPDTEQAILTFTQLPCLGHLDHEHQVDRSTIRRYAEKWQATLRTLCL